MRWYGEVHPLVAAGLLRMAGFEAFDGDAQGEATGPGGGREAWGCKTFIIFLILRKNSSPKFVFCS